MVFLSKSSSPLYKDFLKLSSCADWVFTIFSPTTRKLYKNFSKSFQQQDFHQKLLEEIIFFIAFVSFEFQFRFKRRHDKLKKKFAELLAKDLIVFVSKTVSLLNKSLNTKS